MTEWSVVCQNPRPTRDLCIPAQGAMRQRNETHDSLPITHGFRSAPESLRFDRIETPLRVSGLHAWPSVGVLRGGPPVFLAYV